MRRPITFVAAVLLAAATVHTTATAASGSSTPASTSDVSQYCQESGYCVFSGTSFTGTRAIVPLSYGCHPVADLGFATSGSAARGYGDGTALQLFADTTCTTRVATVYHEVPATTATSYRLMPIPA